MKLECTRKKYTLTDEGKQLATLQFPSILFNDAVLAVPGKEPYSVFTKGFFRQVISVTQNNTEVATIKLIGMGNLNISFTNGPEYNIKHAGAFSGKYIVENKAGEKLFHLEPYLSWRTFSYHYNLVFEKKPEDALVVLLSVYGVGYMIAMLAAIL